jgi:hypothetical protein
LNELVYVRVRVCGVWMCNIDVLFVRCTY